jgi:hypothetical protein
MSFTDAALHLTQFGFKVFALMPGQKIPAISKKDGGRRHPARQDLVPEAREVFLCAAR